MPQSSLSLYLETQRQLYLAKLPERIDQMQAALKEFRQLGDTESCAVALAYAHKLTGSGGTFGFPQVSEAASTLEKVLARCHASGSPLRPEEAYLLDACLEVLKAARVHAEALPATQAPDLAPPAALPEPHIPHARLIDIVEPDPRAAGALTRRLGQSGYRTRVFDKPSLLAASPADGATAAILANMDLPEDELQILRALARPHPHEESEVPLIFMARERDFHARLSAVRAGGVGYFPQPVDVRSLLNLLDRVTSDEPSRPYRVLIIEDDENLGAFYAEVLHSAGIVTSVVTDPAAVTGLLTSFRPDLITCDIYMPECNGIELAALIRQQEEFVRIPIVFLSIETSLDKQSHALRQGGDDFIIKPVQPANLISAVQSKARRYRTLLAAEDTLRISDERFRLVFETSLDGFIQTLADGTIVSANQAACNMFEMTEQELRHIGLAGIVDNANLGLHILQGMQGRTGKYRGEFICIRASGLRFPAEISASQHVSGNGDIQGSIILRDISARKVAEEKVMQLNAELEDRVARRTAELTAANLELRAFSHSMAHDLRQPYIAINGLASLMEREIADHLTERGKHYLSRIRACVHQMNECTDSLLSLAQLSQTTTYREKVDLAALCNSLLADLQLKEPERIVQIQVQTPLEADGDAKLLLHLLRNLLGNAWKFTSRQDEAVIDVSSQAGPDGKTVYCIRDNGAGFDMTYADNLFGAFQRLHSPSEFSGVGIGLATARRIVTRHGGRIWAESAPHQGASFYFTLGA